MDKRYTVAQAVKLTGVKSHVMRYWEEELSLEIGRNELGHRFYTEENIQLFRKVKELKSQGMQLKTIREQLGLENRDLPGKQSVHRVEEQTEQSVDQKPEADERIRDNRQIVSEPSGKILKFQEILERLITQEIQARKEGESRCRGIDEAIRRQQQARREAAAAVSAEKNRKKKRIHI